MQRTFGRIAGFSLVVLSVAVLSLSALGQSFVQDRIVQPVDDSSVVTLKGNVYPLATAKYDQGAAPVSQPMNHVKLVLQRSAAQEVALEKFLASLQDKNSPNYHKWLTPEQYGELYGPSDNDIAKLTGWLVGKGFTVNSVSKGTVIDFSGSVAQVQNAFHTAIHSYKAGGLQFVANTSDPQIPSALAPVVAGIAHLNTVPAQPLFIRGAHGRLDPATHRIVPVTSSAKPALTGGDSSDGYTLFVMPGDAATIYDTPNSTFNANFASGTTYDGTGVTIGIAGQSSVDTGPVVNYRTTFLGSSYGTAPTIYDPDGVGVNDAEDESFVDTELAGALAPGAAIQLYVAADVVTAAERAIAANTIDILSISYGDCESDQGNAGNAEVNADWQQATGQGITVVVATGDTGSAGCDVTTDSEGNSITDASGGLAVNGLASTPYNLAVGGTDYDVLTNYSIGGQSNGNFGNYVNTSEGSASTFYRTAKKFIPENPWNDSTLINATVAQNEPLTANINLANYASIAAGSGGKSSCAVQIGTGSGQGYLPPADCSSGYAKPTWQTGNGVPNDLVRDVPDVSLFAADGAYSAVWGICDDYTPEGEPEDNCSDFASNGNIDGYGGTSTSTPAWASILALVRQKTGGRLGLAPQVIYSLYNSNSSIFHDVTVGNNSVPCVQDTANAASCVANTATYFFETGYNTNAGYDLATGLGSVDVSLLVNNWSSTNTPLTPTITLTPSSTSIAVTDPVTIAVTVAGPSGSATPTGSVTLTGGGYTSAATTLVSGAASIVIPAGSLAVGSDVLQVAYTPDTASTGVYYAGSQSTTVTVGGSFTLTATNPTVTAGATTGNTATVTVSTSDGYTGTVAFTCTLTTPAAGSNASYYPGCTISNATIASGATTATATATFTTTARSTTTGLLKPEGLHPANHWYTAVGGATLAGLLFFGIPARRRGWKSMLALLVFLVTMAGVGCSGGGSNNNPPVTIGTTAGSYVFTVTGKDSVSTTSATTMVTLTVQ